VHETGGETWDTYLVEHYGPGSSMATLGRVARDVRRTTDEMTRRGQPVRYVRSTIVPGDQAFMATFEAASEALVREACARAGVDLARISRAIQPERRR
jgi:Nickel responsive protein SCO4226-like